MGLQRQEQTSDELKGQLHQWSDDKREAEQRDKERAKEEDERQAMIAYAVNKRENRLIVRGVAVVAGVLNIVAIVCGYVGGVGWGTALSIGLIAMLINSFIIGCQAEISRDGRGGWFHESILLKVFGGVAVAMLVLILIYKGGALIFLGIATMIVEIIVYLVVDSGLTELDNFINDANDEDGLIMYEEAKHEKRMGLLWIIIGVIVTVIIGIGVILLKNGKNSIIAEETKFENMVGHFIDSRDGQKYKTVTIGGKRWIAQNLNYQIRVSWCYENNNTYCNKYGRLYDWQTAMVACPTGWRLPTDEEWYKLFVDVGNYEVAGKALKAKSGWKNNGNGDNSYEFSALPGGNRRTNGRFENAGDAGFWWTATKYGNNEAYDRRMSNNSNYVVNYNNGIGNGYSVRCLQDN